MSNAAAIGDVLRSAGIEERVEADRGLSGGCIHDVRLVRLAGDREVVAKIARASALSLFEEEAAGLRALASTATAPVPEPLAIGVSRGHAVLIMTAIPTASVTDRAWRRLGTDLATMHRVRVGERYGFECDNHLGATPQPNPWCGDWVEFNREHRLGHQLSLAASAGLLRSDERRTIESVIARLDRLLPVSPFPSFLHGDLWSGNTLPTTGERVAIIDPACSIGDGWADIAMMRLFGGVPESCFAAYGEAIDDHDQVETRIAVYQLYHLLNHVNLFGRGYVGQAMAVTRLL